MATQDIMLCFQRNDITSCMVIDKKDLETWESANSNATILGAFPIKCDIIKRQNLLKDTFLEKCWSYGFSPDDLDSRFDYRGHTVILKGIAPKNRRYPIIIYDENDDKSYKITKTAARNYLQYIGR